MIHAVAYAFHEAAKGKGMHEVRGKAMQLKADSDPTMISAASACARVNRQELGRCRRSASLRPSSDVNFHAVTT